MDKTQVDSVLHDEHNKSQSIRLTREGIHILVCQVFTGVAEFLARELLQLKERHSERPMEGPLGCFKESWGWSNCPQAQGIELNRSEMLQSSCLCFLYFCMFSELHIPDCSFFRYRKISQIDVYIYILYIYIGLPVFIVCHAKNSFGLDPSPDVAGSLQKYVEISRLLTWTQTCPAHVWMLQA